MCSVMTWFLLWVLIPVSSVSGIRLEEGPAGDNEWGYRPAEGASLGISPPSFCWRPQEGIVAWELECAPSQSPDAPIHSVSGLKMSVHCPWQVFPSGAYTWRYRGVDGQGDHTNWSRRRTFTIREGAVPMPMPRREELLARIPKTHPRLFIRPEDVPRLRELAQGAMKEPYARLIERCDQLLANPPVTSEPRKFPEGMQRGGYEWTLQWWGNRLQTVNALDGAATLGFARLLGGKDEYGALAKQILLACATWDPQGATGYRYNDECGMPYLYLFSRAYTFVYDLLTEEERDRCRRVIQFRGREKYEHLYPRHFWRPYVSHNARAWHFLGEAGIAFLGEVEGADEWVWAAANVFYNVYPNWSDEEGGWHEGFSYWHSYVGRFTWWADVMRSAMGINAYDRPFLSQATGYYAMYLMPPGRVGSEFGDGANRVKETNIVPLFGEDALRDEAANALLLMSELAARSGNGHWQWYVEQLGGPAAAPGYIGFARGVRPEIKPKAPDDLPTSRLFRGTGIACLNSTLRSAADDVQVLFKASPMGTQSHGIDSHNSFALWAYGQRMLIRTGHYYAYGAPHHADWVWATRSQNNITVDGQGQVKHSASSKGKIVAFKTTPSIDVVVGEAADAYRVPEGEKERHLLDRYTRAILFVKPDLVIIFDRLQAKEPATFEYRLHALNKFEITDPQALRVRAEDVVCEIEMLAPQGLSITQTDQYDPNPWPQITVREWHLTASTPAKSPATEFVTLYRPHRSGETVARPSLLKAIDGGYVLTADVADGRVVALLPTDDAKELAAEGLSSRGAIQIQLRRADGSVVETVTVSTGNDGPAPEPSPSGQ